MKQRTICMNTAASPNAQLKPLCPYHQISPAMMIDPTPLGARVVQGIVQRKLSLYLCFAFFDIIRRWQMPYKAGFACA